MPESRVEPLDKDIDLLISENLSPAARSEVLAEFARETLAEAEAANEAALGHPTPHETFVDGRAGAIEESVRPEGVIVYEFDLVEELFAWIDEQLIKHSPVGSGNGPHPGLYQRSHKFFADDVEADPLAPPPGLKVGVFLNTQPYSRKIDAGESPQQPDGVYEVVTHMASQRFGNIARIQFDYRDAGFRGVRTAHTSHPYAAVKVARGKQTGRNPAIIVTVK